jgi:hypothetical protein
MIPNIIVTNETHPTEFKVQLLKQTAQDNMFGTYIEDTAIDDTEAYHIPTTIISPKKKKAANDKVNAMLHFQSEVFPKIKEIVTLNLGPILHSCILSELATEEQGKAMTQLTQ